MLHFLFVVGYLDTLLQTNKPVFIAYGYSDMNLWAIIVACGANNGMNVKDSLNIFQPFLNKHKNIAGFVFYGFDIIVRILHTYM